MPWVDRIQVVRQSISARDKGRCSSWACALCGGGLWFLCSVQGEGPCPNGRYCCHGPVRAARKQQDLKECLVEFCDLLHKLIVDLAMEFLCAKWRTLPHGSKQALQNLYGSSWLAASCYTVWMDAWVLLEPQRRSAYISYTYDIDSDFAGAMVNKHGLSILTCGVYGPISEPWRVLGGCSSAPYLRAAGRALRSR